MQMSTRHGMLFACCLLELLACGCRPRTSDRATSVTLPFDNSAIDEPLRVWVVEAPKLAAVIEREWRAHSQSELETRQATTKDLEANTVDTDVLIFPSSWLGQLVSQQQIFPWPESSQPSSDDNPPDSTRDYNWTDVFASVRRHELKWGNQRYGVSFGSPQFVLMYRQDLFEKWKLSPPETWESYAELVRQIADRIREDNPHPDRPTLVPTLEPQGPGWSARLLIARSAAYARDPNQYSTLIKFSTMKAMIDGPPFVRGLNEQIALRHYQPNEVLELSLQDVTGRFLQGQSVMAIGWPSAGNQVQETTVDNAQFAFTSLPGSQQFYSVSQNLCRGNGKTRWSNSRTFQRKNLVRNEYNGR